jgi:thiol:disulfide interchange protein DsbD
MKKALLLLLIIFNFSIFAFDQSGILKPEEAFKATAVKSKDSIHTTIKLAPEIYIYDEMLKYTITEPKEINLDKLIKRPKPENFHDFIVHRGKDVVVDIPLSLIKEKVGDGTFTLKINYQGCSEKGLCYQPLSKTFKFDTATTSNLNSDKKNVWKVSGSSEDKKTSKDPEIKKKEQRIETTEGVVESEEDQIVNTLKSGSISTILALFFGFGLLLALTPCIFPMIPILSSIIVSQSGDGKEKMSATRGLFLSLVYVLAMSIAYTVAGVLAGLFGANIQTAMQNPWVISIFALVFVALAFSMFGYYEIQLPRTLQNKISKTSDEAKGSGGLLGVAIMGFLSALIVGPCVAPALAGALVYIGQTGDALLGGAALFVMSLGMGVPLLIVGAGAGKFMPKPGGWMTLVSQIFGVVMLAIAIWMLSRIIPGSISLFLWALLFIGSGVYAGAFETFPQGISGAKKLIKVFAIMLTLIGAIMLIGSFSGATNPLNPLEKFGACTPIGESQKKVEFKIVKTVAELENEIKNSNKRVLIDFSADWCASCKELEHITFPDPTVSSLMSKFKLLRVDVTKNSDTDKELLKKYNIFGPPAIIFYDASGNELKNFKTIGYKPPEVFAKTLNQVLAK